MPKSVLIWDIPVRLFHWLLVPTIAYSWYAIEIKEDLEQHFISGYCVLTLVSFRVIWGLVGTDYARFKSFIYPLTEMLTYIRALPQKTNKTYPGHNPAGGLAVIAMLLFILIQISTGLFSTDDYYFGPLNALVSDTTAATLTKIHHLNFDIITILIALHVLAIAFYRVVKKERLVKAMITGRKETEDTSLKPIASSRLWLAIVVICVCAAGAYWLANTSLDSEQNPVEYDFY